MKFTCIFVTATLLLVSCARQADIAVEPPSQSVQIQKDSAVSGISVSVLEPTPGLTETESEKAPVETGGQLLWPDGEVRSDEQGSVEVVVAPVNLNVPTTSLNFEVSLNTHSVDLSMDLAPLATLDADNGISVRAVRWDAPRGGHHVAGVLSFPAEADGAVLLENTSRLTLTIRDVDAPERVFIWNVSQ